MMKIIELNPKSGLKFIFAGLFALFISFMFIPGKINPVETPGFVSLIIFIVGSVIVAFGLVKVIGGLSTK